MPISPKELGGAVSGPSGVFPYSIDYSALFDGGSDYLSYTPSAEGNRKVWTLRFCLKRSDRGVLNNILGVVYSDENYYECIRLTAAGQLEWQLFVAGGYPQGSILTDGIFVDETNHYDIVVTRNGTTAAIYVNGVLAGEDTSVNDVDGYFNSTSVHEFGISSPYVGTTRFSGYMSDVYWIDGTSYSANTWGELSGLVTRLWIPKDPGTLTYGTNGCHLDFSNATGLGEDSSGNGNDWTVNGSPVQTVDTPTNNHCTLNALFPSTTTLSNGNTTITNGGNVLGAFGIDSIAAYFEATLNAVSVLTSIGISDGDLGQGSGTGDNCLIYGSDGKIYEDGVEVFDTSITYAVSDVISVAYDAVSNEVSFYKNNSLVRTQTRNGSGLQFPCCVQNSISDSFTFEFGAQGFTYTPPTGFSALSTSNLPDPTILKSSTVADIVLREGTGAATSVSGLEFAPDFINIKNRDAVKDWILHDTERGRHLELETNTTDAQASFNSGLTDFNSDGYDLGTLTAVNALNNNFIDLCLKAGLDQGFYQEANISHTNGVATAITHNLGAAVTWAMVKRTDATGDWWIFTGPLEGDYYSKFTTASVVSSPGFWSTNTSTTFDIPSSLETGTYVVYLFTDSDIFKTFSYIGNGSADGPFVNLGGRPLSIPFLKNANATAGWVNQDTARNPHNPVDAYLLTDSDAAEATTVDDGVYATSQGFKVVNGNDTGWNGSGNIIVGLAILESTKYSNAF